MVNPFFQVGHRGAHGSIMVLPVKYNTDQWYSIFPIAEFSFLKEKACFLDFLFSTIVFLRKELL